MDLDRAAVLAGALLALPMTPGGGLPAGRAGSSTPGVRGPCARRLSRRRSWPGWRAVTGRFCSTASGPKDSFPAVSWRASTPQQNCPPENPSVFGPIMVLKSPCIMHSALYPSRSSPTDSADEPKLEWMECPYRRPVAPVRCAARRSAPACSPGFASRSAKRSRPPRFSLQAVRYRWPR